MHLVIALASIARASAPLSMLIATAAATAAEPSANDATQPDGAAFRRYPAHRDLEAADVLLRDTRSGHVPETRRRRIRQPAARVEPVEPAES